MIAKEVKLLPIQVLAEAIDRGDVLTAQREIFKEPNLLVTK